MDRQSILEQKRQRLEELRKKRLESSIEQNTSAVQSSEQDQPESQEPLLLKVDASVQTIGFPNHPNHSSVIQFSEITRFSKGIQTDKKEYIELSRSKNPKDSISNSDKGTKPKTETQNGHSESFIEVESIVDEQLLNSQLKESLLLLHEVFYDTIFHDTSKLKHTIDKDLDPIYVIQELVPFKTKIPMTFDASSKPEEFVVGFSSSARDDYEGFAVIFRTLSNNKVIPIYYLACTSYICEIKFDIFNDKRVLGGLKNGRIVVWEITDKDNGTTILPSLVSPHSYTNKALHTKPITSICQFNSEPNTFITTCAEGLINIWSVNFLEHPKYDTIKIPNESEAEDGISILGETYKSIHKALVVKDIEHSLLRYSYLNSLAIKTSTGSIHYLCNEPKSGYVDSTIPTKMLGSVTFIGSHEDTLVLAATSYTSNIHLFNTQKEILKISKTYLVLNICQRPSRQFQFISFGIDNEANNHSIVDFWDLVKNVRKPVYSIVIESQGYPINGDFNSSGDQFYLGFNDGKLSTLKIEDGRLENYATQDTIYDII